MSDRSLELCTRRGLAGQEMWTRAERLWLLYDVGRWDEIIEQTDVLEAWSAAHGDTQSRVAALPYRARVLARRGQLAEARALAETFLPLARQIGDLQIAAPAVMVAAVIEERAGRFDEALKLLREFDETTSDGPAEYRELLLPEAVRACLAAGDVDLARQLMGARDVHAARTRLAVDTCRAALAEADGDLEAAAVAFGAVAGAWDAWGAPAETACALAGRARVRRALGDVEAADEDVRAAQARFAALGIE